MCVPSHGRKALPVSAAQLSLGSQVLLQPLGVPPTPAPAMLHTNAVPEQCSLEGAYNCK